VLGVELGRAQRDPLLGCRTGEIILGQIGPIVRPRVVGAQHRDPAGVALAPQHLGRGISPGTTADDNDRLRPRIRTCRPSGGLKLFPDINRPLVLLDPPARDRIERWRMQRLPAAQAEAGVVPWAADGVGDEDPLGERTVIMGTLRPDGEQRAAVAREHHRFARDLPQDHAALGKIRDGDPLGKVGSNEFCVLLAHDCLPMPAKLPP